MKLKQMGVSITVDDFGTGYSSLSYLARLPIQSVKIDQRFVHGLDHNSNDEAITQAIIALSHSLGLRCIAEGVETAAQFNFLRGHGCEEAQGFLISHPLTRRPACLVADPGGTASRPRGAGRSVADDLAAPTARRACARRRMTASRPRHGCPPRGVVR